MLFVHVGKGLLTHVSCEAGPNATYTAHLKHSYHFLELISLDWLFKALLLELMLFSFDLLVEEFLRLEFALKLWNSVYQLAVCFVGSPLISLRFLQLCNLLQLLVLHFGDLILEFFDCWKTREFQLDVVEHIMGLFLTFALSSRSVLFLWLLE